MDQTPDLTAATTPGTETKNHPTANHQPNQRNRTLAVVGFILTILAWIAMPIWDWLSVGLVVIALVCSAMGCRIPPGPRRNLAITATVAASSLLLAIIVIWIGLAIIL